MATPGGRSRWCRSTGATSPGTHDDILVLRKLAAGANGPIAALIQDLKTQVFSETVIVISGGLGGLGMSQQLGEGASGETTTITASPLVAGGGFKGSSRTAPPTVGFKAVESGGVHGLHAAILHQQDGSYELTTGTAGAIFA
jgi:hypothetical protein